MTEWIYKWLPIFFGCHCRADRSFHYKGKQFPICARCTGEMIGMILFLVSCFFWMPPYWLCLVLMSPLIVDGFTQKLTRYESTNFRRVVTGLLFGYGLAGFFILNNIYSFRFGYNLRK